MKIDEYIIVKRKYERGCLVRIQWVFGGSNVIKQRFIVTVPDAKRDPLFPIINQYIRLGTLIKAYYTGFIILLSL